MCLSFTGLYQRALILKNARDDGIEYTVPLRFLSRYFAINALIPMKRLGGLTFTMNPPSKVFIKEPSDTNAYSLSITKCHLDISLITLEANIRREFYSLIDQDGLVRMMPVQKAQHFPLAKGSKEYSLPSACTFSELPSFIMLFMITESKHIGMFGLCNSQTDRQTDSFS